MNQVPQTSPTETGNRYTIMLCYGGGVVLLVMGLILVGFGSLRMFFKAPQPQAKNEMIPAAAVDTETSWRLSARGDGVWLARSLDETRETELPDFLPRSPLFQPPERPMAAAEMGTIFLQAMERNQYTLSKDEYFRLLQLQLDEDSVFTDRTRLGNLVAGDQVTRQDLKSFDRKQSKPKPEPEGESPAASVPLEDVRQETPPSPKEDFPARYNPRAPQFTANMRTWKSEVLGALRDASPSRRGYPISWLYGSKKVTMNISANARSRILSEGWGTARRDKLIWLQVLINTGKDNLLVDGKFGKNSKAALNRWLRSVMSGQEAEAASEALQAFLNRQ